MALVLVFEKFSARIFKVLENPSANMLLDSVPMQPESAVVMVDGATVEAVDYPEWESIAGRLVPAA